MIIFRVCQLKYFNLIFFNFDYLVYFLYVVTVDNHFADHVQCYIHQIHFGPKL